MREHQSQPRNTRLSDIFSSPMPTRSRHHQVENSAPFLSDLSPFPISFSNRPLLGVPQVNMEMIQTPMGNQRYIAAQSMIESIIDWDEPKASIMHGHQNPEDNDEGVSDQASGSSQDEDQYEESMEDQKQAANETPIKATRQKKQQQQHSSSEQDIPSQMMVSKLKVKNVSHQKPQVSNGQKKVTCNCKKTKCLKLYCDCFRINQVCTDGCNCCGCHNTVNYEEQRNNAILTLLERNQQGFRPKIEGNQHSKGCNCKKSGCLKKYCECYQAGLKCTELCKCQDCKNTAGGCNHKDKPKKESREIMLRQLAQSISPVKQPRSASKMISRTTAKKQGRFQQFVNL